MKDYESFYKNLTKIYNTKQKIYVLKVLNKAFTYLMYIAYPILLLWLLAHKDRRLIKVILIPFLFFVALTLVRDRINAPRPYEEGIIPLIYKDTKGHSMPSRHIFSSAVISMCYLYICTPLGILFMMVTLAEAYIRVAGGIHYPRDVGIGLLAGILSGMLLYVL